MNREIKFRAWDKKEKKMIYEVGATPSGNAFIFEGWVKVGDMGAEHRGSMTELIRGERAELMQFTGLHDKNGKEIYEGDIVKAHEVIPSTNELQKQIQGADAVQLDFIGQVEWDNEGADYQVTDGIYVRGLGMERQVLEIIGNICENPDLLTPESK